MTKYEILLDTADKFSLKVHEKYDFSGTRIKGLYCDGSIAISDDLETEAEKRCVLAEEVGHHLTSYGNIIDQNDIQNRKQEYRARSLAYRLAFDLSDLISAYKKGCCNQFEIAEYLGVTEEFLSDAIEYYRRKYGIYTTFDRYIIYFEPLGILEICI